MSIMYKFCANEVVCDACRNEPSFRAQAVKSFGISDVNFPCPLGKPLNIKVEAKKAPITKRIGIEGNAELAKHRFEICKQCEHSKQDGFMCDLYKRCCFGSWRAKPDSKCPVEKW